MVRDLGWAVPTRTLYDGYIQVRCIDDGHASVVMLNDLRGEGYDVKGMEKR